MTVKVHDFVARLLSEYENITGETHSKIAGDMDIPVSNYYLYRNGMGNPTGNTIKKMVAVIQTNQPEVLIETIRCCCIPYFRIPDGSPHQFQCAE